MKHCSIVATFRSQALAALLILASVAAAADGRLYKTYRFSMSEDDLMATNAAIYDCSEEFFVESGWFCLDGQEFAGYEAMIAFEMIDRSLISVTLFTTHSGQQYVDLITALISRFQLTGIASGDESMDILADRHGQSRAALMQQVSEFEAVALSRGDIVYTFVEQAAFESAGPKSKSYMEFMMKAADDFRAAEYAIFEDDTGEVTSSILFTLPNRLRRLLVEKTQRDVGDF